MYVRLEEAKAFEGIYNRFSQLIQETLKFIDQFQSLEEYRNIESTEFYQPDPRVQEGIKHYIERLEK